MQTFEPILSPNALRALEARYLRKDISGRLLETPGGMFQRVARAVAAAEPAYGASPAEVEQTERDFYEMMARTEFLPNSPTLMNAGRRLGMLSACFVLPIDDSIDAIFESVKHTALIQKAGGGTGFSFDRLRPTGDYVASSGGTTSGPISFWRVFCEATRAIQQGAFRRGANMGMMSVDRPDILKFISAKERPGEFENFNISVKVTDAFMCDLRSDGDRPHVVTNPHTGERYTLPAGLDVATYSIHDLAPHDGRPAPPYAVTSRQVWDRIVRGAWATGEPGLCFIDRVNADNPTPQVGRIEATNPCGEQPLLDYEACNLGSVDVSKFVRDGRLDEAAFSRTVRLGVRFLDDVIDVNNYVIPAVTDICRRNRKIGLGVMGLADALMELEIPYDSEEGLAFGRRVAELFTREAFAADEELARRRGCFANWPGSVWDVRHHRPMRNAAVTTVAPTGTLSLIAGCSGGIEPVYALAFYRHVLGGQEMLDLCGPFLRYARRHGIWNDDLARRLAGRTSLGCIEGLDARTREIFVTAHDVAPAWHVRMQAVFQEHVDGAISKTINLPADATLKDVEDVYQLAFDLRCKGVTVYRDGCRTGQPMTTEKLDALCPRCQALLEEIDGACSRCPSCGAPLCS